MVQIHHLFEDVIGGSLLGLSSSALMYYCGIWGDPLSIFASIVRAYTTQRRKFDDYFLHQCNAYLFGVILSTFLINLAELAPSYSYVVLHRSDYLGMLYLFTAGFLYALGSLLARGSFVGFIIIGLPYYKFRSFWGLTFISLASIFLNAMGTQEYVEGHLITEHNDHFVSDPWVQLLYFSGYILILMIYGLFYILSDIFTDEFKKIINGKTLPLFNGMVFGFGVVISGMSSPLMVLRLFSLNDSMDPLIVFGTALILNFAIKAGSLTSRIMTEEQDVIEPKFVGAAKQNLRPLYTNQKPFKTTSPQQVDKSLLMGGLIQGVGLGLAGIGISGFFANLCFLSQPFAAFGAGMVISIIGYEALGNDLSWTSAY